MVTCYDAGTMARVSITEVANDLHYANGVVLGADRKRLYVNEFEAGRVISFAVADDGTLSDRRLFVRLGVVDEVSGIGAYPDGIKLGPDGNFYIGQYSKGRIVRCGQGGQVRKSNRRAVLNGSEHGLLAGRHKALCDVRR